MWGNKQRKKNMLSSLKDRIEARRHDGNLDSGDVVQTVILIAGFVIVAILVVVWLGTAVLNKGADAGKCIEGSNAYAGNNSTNAEACKGGTANEGDNSFQKDSGYTQRYGS